MKATVIVQKETSLTLTEEEAQWLQAVVQNPIGCTPEKKKKKKSYQG